MPGPGSPSSRRPHVALGLYVATALAALIWPGLDLAANRVEPRILGLPFSLAWVAGWALSTCLVLALYLRATEKAEDP